MKSFKLFLYFFLISFYGIAQRNLSITDYQKQEKSFIVACKTTDTDQTYTIQFSFPSPNTVHFVAGDFKGNEKATRENKYDFSLEDAGNNILLSTRSIEVKIGKPDMAISVKRPFESWFFQGFLQITSHPEYEKSVIAMNHTIKPEEGFFGFGERLNGFDQRGNRVVMELGDCWCESGSNAYKSIPFYYSSRSFAVLINSHQRYIFDIGQQVSDQMQIISPDKQMNSYIFASPSPIKIMEQYTNLTGRSPDIPDWSLEPWLSRRSMTGWDDPKTVKAQVDAMNANGMHLGVILWEGIRRHFGEHQNPSTGEMVNYFHNKGMKVICWDRTGHITDNAENRKKYGYDDPEIKKYFVRDHQGNLFRATRSGEVYNPDMDENPVIYIDVTNPEAMEWWFDDVLGYRINSENGASSSTSFNTDGIKVDFSEGFPQDTASFQMKNPIEGMENAYPVMYGKKVYEWLQKKKENGGIIWQRGGGLGLQKVGPVWNGDRMRRYAQFQGTIESLLSASASGIALAGHDLGGYMSGDNPFAREVYIRGAQFAAFSPFFHDHGSAQAPWEQTQYGRDNYGFYTRVRYNLMPYLTKLVDVAHRSGIPMMRPLFFHHPDDSHAWKANDSYYFGRDMLVAPFVHTGNVRDIYLPAGEWVDLWSNKIYDGGQTIMYRAPLNQIPVFVKKEAILPLALNDKLSLGGNFKHSNKNNLRLTFEIFAQTSRSYTYTEDNQSEINLEYLTEDRSITLKARGVQQKLGFIIHCGMPDYITLSDKRLNHIPGDQFSGAEQGWTYDHNNRELKIKIAKQPGNDRLTCKIKGKSLNTDNYIKGERICSVPQPSVPEKIEVTEWNGSIDFSFERNEDLSMEYVFGSNFSDYISQPAGLGEHLTINGLEKGQSYGFRVWKRNQFGAGIETQRIIAETTTNKSVTFPFTGEHRFIKGNHFVKKENLSEDSTRYTYLVNNKGESGKIRIWGKVEKNTNIHHNYPRWYPLKTIDLGRGRNEVSLTYPSQYELAKIFLSRDPEERPLFKDKTQRLQTFPGN